VVGAEVVRERVVENLAVPTPVFEVDRGRVGTLAVLVVTNRSVHGLSTDWAGGVRWWSVVLAGILWLLATPASSDRGGLAD
jgi:hypothetical protein